LLKIKRLAQAHARLMFRETVTIQDSVIAVLLMESSMYTSALLGVSSALHSRFPEDPGKKISLFVFFFLILRI
jgi:DNA helicase MCM9